MLRVERLQTAYGECPVLRGVSLRAEEGQIVIVLGPNGHGKSTLLKSVCGLVRPQSGSVRFREEELTALPAEKIVERGITYIPEDRHLFPEMTILENLRLGAYNRNARAKTEENLEYVLATFPRLKQRARRPASTLSGGEARMLAIGRGLMSNARLLAIDEPSLGLAPNLREEMFQKIAEINRRGISILLVEQSMPQLAEIASRIYLLEEGLIVFEGDREAALGNPQIREVFLGF